MRRDRTPFLCCGWALVNAMLVPTSLAAGLAPPAPRSLLGLITITVSMLVHTASPGMTMGGGADQGQA